MPKVSKKEWEQFLDPASQEHAPTREDLEKEGEVIRNIKERLCFIENELRHPGEDYYTGEKTDFHITNPEGLWDALVYLRLDQLERIKDPEEKAEYERRILKLEQKIYRHYIPFIESQINLYGLDHSPLEKKYSSRRLGLSEISMQEYFDNARYAMNEFDLTDDQRVDFENEINALQEKFDRYQSEPTLYSFERIERELIQLLLKLRFPVYYPSNDSRVGLADEKARQENIKIYDLRLAKAHQLKEIADRMMIEEIKQDCVRRAEYIYRRCEEDKFKYEAPQELLILEAKIDDLVDRLKAEQTVEDAELVELERKVVEMKAQADYSYKTKLEKLEKKLGRVKRAVKGEKVDFEEAEVDFGAEGMKWAWGRLGVTSEMTFEEIKKVYRKLVLKYHPDRNKDKKAEDNMKKINEAFGFIKAYHDQREQISV